MYFSLIITLFHKKYSKNKKLMITFLHLKNMRRYFISLYFFSNYSYILDNNIFIYLK